MKTGILLTFGAIVAGTIYAVASGKKEDVPVTDELPPVQPKEKAVTPVKIIFSDRIAKIQSFLNTIPDLAKSVALSVDGQNGPNTQNRIKMFQQILKAKHPDQGVTGTWGEQTEANTLKRYGRTPFQAGTNNQPGKSTTTPEAFTPTEILQQQLQKNRLLNGLVYGIGVTINFRQNPKVNAPISQTIKQALGVNPLGKVVDVVFEKGASGLTRTYLLVDYAGKQRGWASLSDVSVYNNDFKTTRLAGEFEEPEYMINGL